MSNIEVDLVSAGVRDGDQAVVYGASADGRYVLIYAGPAGTFGPDHAGRLLLVDTRAFAVNGGDTINATQIHATAAQHVDPLTHFLAYGMQEGRSSFADGVWG
jgi:hypothetical protein